MDMQLAPETDPSPLAKVAGGGNNIQQQAFQQLLDKGNAKQTYMEKQQAAYNSELENYAQMVQQSRQPENQEAGMWGAMSTAASKFAPTWGNIGPGIAAVGGAAGMERQAQQNENLKNQHDLTQMRQAEVRALEARDQSAAMMKALAGGTGGGKASWIHFKDDAGNLHLMDKSQGPSTEVVIPATQNAQWLKLLAQGNEIAVKQDEPNKEQFALDYAANMMRMIKPGLASTVAEQPPTVAVGRLPVGADQGLTDSNATVAHDASQGSTQKADIIDGFGAESTGPGTVDVKPGVVDMLSPQDQATAARLVARINANPASAANDMKRLGAIIAKYDERNASPLRAAGQSTGSIAAAAGRKTAAEENAKLGVAQQMKFAEAQGAGEGKQVVEASEKKTVLENYLAEAGQTKDVIDGLVKHPGLQKASGFEGYIPGRGRVTTVANTDSAEFMAALKTLESRITSLALQNARVGSSSGATGFGALDAGEREMLRDSMASLSLQQSPEKLRANLERIQKIVANSEARAREGYARTYVNKTDSAAAQPLDAYEAWKAKKGLK